MRLTALLNYINACQRGCRILRITLTFTGKQSGINYELSIHKGKFVLIRNNDKIDEEGNYDNSLSLDFSNDIEFAVIKYRETSFSPDGSFYEDKSVNVRYLAQIYIYLFRNLGDRINLICKYEDKYFDCYYVDGKLMYGIIKDGVYCLHGTNLYAFNGDYPNYEILMFSEANIRPGYGDFLSSCSALSKTLGLGFKKCFNNTDCVVNL